MNRRILPRSPLALLLVATTIAAVLDATFAFFGYVVIDGRYNFESLLQYIASGLLGDDAFRGGLTGWLIAGMGFGLHLVISATVAAVYLLTLRRLTHTRVAAAVVGTVYGAAVWMFMRDMLSSRSRVLTPCRDPWPGPF